MRSSVAEWVVGVSSQLANAERQQARDAEWARLIPGELPSLRGAGKKPARSAKPYPTETVKDVLEDPASSPVTPLELFIPSPLRSRRGGAWLRFMAADCALVGLDWLLVGALLVPLRALFPHVRSFAYAAGAPFSLLGIALLHAALITLVGYTEGLHAGGVGLQAQMQILAKSVLLATMVLCFAYGLQGAPWTISGLFCVAGTLHFSTLSIWRWFNEERERHSHHGGDAHNVLIVGAGRVGQRVAAYLEQHPAEGRRLCGFLDDEKPIGKSVIGRVSDLARIARQGFVDEVILAAPRARELTLQVVHQARRLRLDLDVIPDLFGCSLAVREIEQVNGLPVLCLHAERLPAAGMVLKRLTDVLGAGLALIALAPLLAAIALLIKLDSAGTVLYCAPRVGRKGRVFRCCKFRTMVSNADELKDALRRVNERSGPIFKVARDPRITRVGHYLRRYSLDELPQLWNVLRGEMSLVGPRPHPLDDVAAYEIEHLARLDVTPGITGLWQVTARRNPSFQRGMELDREYIRTWSLGLDLRILLRTFAAVIQGSGE